MGRTGSNNSFGAAGHLTVGGKRLRMFRLDALAAGHDISRLPYSVKILLENLLRHEDGSIVKAGEIEALASWDGTPPAGLDVAFRPARVLMQDFTGVPAVVDLAAMREAVSALGGDPRRVNPEIPVELVIDHSVIAEVAGRSEAFALNAQLELERNAERYSLLRWARQAFENFSVVPPDLGICHQVNLEYLSRVVFRGEDAEVYPDTLVGTDSHTTMVNGLGVLGWGVGGIEAEAALLGQPLSMAVPSVVGVKLVGELGALTTATDLVLTIAELLRKHGVVGKFVEMYGSGIASVPLANRATIGNMSPEYGSTCTIFPVDHETLRYLRFSGRPEEQVALVEAYAKEQGLFYEDGDDEPIYTETLTLDLSTVVSSIAGPSRPQDRVSLPDAPTAFRVGLAGAPGLTDSMRDPADEASEESFPASDPPAGGPRTAAAREVGPTRAAATDIPASDARPTQPTEPTQPTQPTQPTRPTNARLVDGSEVTLDHGAVVIAAITSCTNTSNPEVMVGAGLLARKAVERGLRAKPWVKTSLAPGSRVVTDYLRAAKLDEALDALGFHLVGYGCTTCIGNSGPLLHGVSDAIAEGNLVVSAVLSGNRNFEGRIHPEVRMNWLASPPLVVAYALAGSLEVDLMTEPVGRDADGRAVHLSELWPSQSEVNEVITDFMSSEMFRRAYADVFTSDTWGDVQAVGGLEYEWDSDSTYVRRPPFFEGIGPAPEPVTDISGARVLVWLGDSVTTDHISPAGSIDPSGPAGLWLTEAGVKRTDYNSYGARRGNHEVMLRGTFSNRRLRNRMAAGAEGGWTVHLPEGDRCSVYEAAMRYKSEGAPLIVLAGKEYGSGSSRDWAAKGPLLLGVRAVIAESFERIHRSNLVGMGILPLELAGEDSVESLGLTGHETYDISGLGLLNEGRVPKAVMVSADGKEVQVRVRIDTPQEAAYYAHGGILPYVARRLGAMGR